ncbi:MAG: hypothetical protein ABW101_01570 [Candidatus Thiodiazotropha sp.]
MNDADAFCEPNPWVGGVRLTAESRSTLASHYLDRLALTWRRRSKQITSYHHDFSDLLEWDSRILTYLDALTLLEDQICQEGLERLDAPLLDEELFALTLVALRTRDIPLSQACIGLVQAIPRLIGPYAAALTWVRWVDCEAHLELWPKDNDHYLKLYLAASAHYPVVISPQSIQHWVASLTPDPQVGIATLRCGILRGEAEWTTHAQEWLDADHSGLRLAAAEALIVFGSTQARRDMLPVLRDLALDPRDPAVSENAARKLLTVTCNEGRELIDALETDTDRQRLYLQALGWTGEPAAIPRLSERLDDPRDARLAAAVINALLGTHPVRDGWQTEAQSQSDPSGDLSEAEDALPPPDPDAGLPWPDRERFSQWWHNQRHNWPENQRYLGGRPREHAALHDILHQGVLAWRPQAAWHLQIVQRGRRFPWQAPTPHQKHHLANCAERLHG